MGIVLGLEVSRLARNNADWYRLLELCGITDTLIGDNDGVYHPALFNDRLLLGLNRPETQSTSYSTFCWTTSTGIIVHLGSGTRPMRMSTGYTFSASTPVKRRELLSSQSPSATDGELSIPRGLASILRRQEGIIPRLRTAAGGAGPSLRRVFCRTTSERGTSCRSSGRNERKYS